MDRESVEYLELRDSVGPQGFLNSIACAHRPGKPGTYEVVDGLYRYTAACELRLPALPCIVKHSLTDEDVLAIRIQANAVRPRRRRLSTPGRIKRIMDAITSGKRDITLTDVSI